MQKKTIESICRQIDVDPFFETDTSKRHNKTGRPKSSLLNSILWKESSIKEALKKVVPDFLTTHVRKKIVHLNRKTPSPLSTEARSHIIDHLHDDIEATEELLDRDLSHWKT